MNLALRVAHGKSFFVVDSDDTLIETAIQDITTWFSTIENIDDIAGVSGLKGFDTLHAVGGRPKFEGEYVDCGTLEREKYGLQKDKAEVYKTEIIKKFPMPEFEGENFITEVYHTEIAAAGYKLRWYKKIIYLCDYYADGLTQQGSTKFLQNPRGTAYFLNVKEKLYGKSVTDKDRFRYYLLFAQKYTQEEALLYTCNGKAEYVEAFKQRKNYLIQELNSFFSEHQINSIAIYGLGNVGDIFLSLKDELKVNVAFGIDRQQKTKLGINTIKLESPLPKDIDAIIVTMMKYSSDIEKTLEPICHNVYFWCNIAKDNWLW